MTIHNNNFVRQETNEKIQIYLDMLSQWNRQINLIHEDTLNDAYNRHIYDSLQIIPIIQREHNVNGEKGSSSNTKDIHTKPISVFEENQDIYRYDQLSKEIAKLHIIDVGTGAGFPGMVLAMCGFENITVCDINHKKCLFLEEVARKTNTIVTILNQNVESIPTQYQIILSRAYTSLDKLLNITLKLSADMYSCGVFHKGKTWASEMSEANKKYKYNSVVYQSLASDDSVIISCKDIKIKTHEK